ncbi:MAG: hypothetical protein RH917_10035 [Lacipirellulaceae bacterium]
MQGHAFLFAAALLIASGCSSPEFPGSSEAESSQEVESPEETSAEKSEGKTPAKEVTVADSEPTILGFTPAMRAEMRKLIVLQDPTTAPDQVVSKYMNKLKKMAAKLGAEPDENGNIPLPSKLQESVSQWRDKSRDATGQEHLPTAFKAIADDFGMEVPNWIRPLLNIPKDKQLSPEQEELLILTIGLDLIFQLSG